MITVSGSRFEYDQYTNKYRFMYAYVRLVV